MVFVFVLAPLSGFDMRDRFVLTGAAIGGLIPILFSAYRVIPSTIVLDATRYETAESALNAVQQAINRVSSERWLYRYGVIVRRDNANKTVQLLPGRVMEHKLLNFLDSTAFRRLLDAALLYVYIIKCQSNYHVIGPRSVVRELAAFIV